MFYIIKRIQVTPEDIDFRKMYNDLLEKYKALETQAEILQNAAVTFLKQRNTQ